MNDTRAILTIVILAAVCGVTLLAVGQPAGTPDRELGLSKTSVFDVPEPPPEMANTSDPGDRPTTPTNFPEQPPSAPHGIATFLPITLEENQCLDCHAVEEKIEGEPTPMPASHYVDLRNAPDEKRDEVVGARYNCVTCHAAPGFSPLLVDNGFVPGQ